MAVFPTIAIDGPASSGKSAVGFAVAQALGFVFFDTGCLYRAVTALALERALDLHAPQALADLAMQAHFHILPATQPDGRQYTVLVGKRDITWNLRDAAVDSAVSQVASVPAVRAILTAQMQVIATEQSTVMVGRDIGTVVVPGATLKIYLTASAVERARRRHAQNLAQGWPSDYAQILSGLQARDRLDTSRAAAPLTQAPDAVRLDSTHLDLAQTVAQILTLWQAKVGDCAVG
jgi:cytidylate kinase